MAKRKATARTRKAARKVKKTKKTVVRKARKPKARARRRPARPARRQKAPARKAAPKRSRVKASAARPKPAALQRERRRLHDEETIPGAPSTLGYQPKASQAESGHQKYHQHMRDHTKEDPALTGGDLDVDWNDAYSSGEEAPGGDTPTPDQDVVEEIGRALGVEYEDAEELKSAEKIEARDKHRWEYDPASAEDYRDRNKKQ
jgi:hypothetical protein